MIQIAVLGYGTVGSGVVEVIETNKADINKKAGENLSVKYILDLRDFPGDPYADKVVHDYNIILNDPEVAVICETMGGTKPAYDFTKQALLLGKSVCTSNKELVAAHGPELIKIARENHCNYLFEASVGGGIPIIRPLNYSLTAEKIDGITGILNGTTNYILTKMDKEGADFEDVLKEAQDKGYAERNPEADVEGYDACRKIAILSSLMSGRNVRYEEIYTEGITKITAADFKYAKQMGKSIKLLAMSRDTEKGFFAMVAPFMISKEHPLYSVNGVFNAVYVHGNMLGDSMYYGRGAGKLPTASAVVSDVVDCARHQGKTIMCFWDEENVNVAESSSAERKFFVRVRADQRESAMAAFGSLAEVNVGMTEEFAFMTQVMSEKEFSEKIEKAGGYLNRIRIMA
ncbi:MAG: homoserine dehydrogenase [Lachnospiraceae bacterium]|jgi:homoserine dehydrogenase|nr:homoserine dehydrogenase [Lachnospiraceae bacterium]